MCKVLSYFLPGVFYSRFSMQIGNLHLLKKCIFLLFVTLFVPLVAVVLSKELILHLPSTTCSSLLCGHDTPGPCTCSACGEELPLPAVPPQEVAFEGPSAAVEQHNTGGQQGSGQPLPPSVAWQPPACSLGVPQIFEKQESG